MREAYEYFAIILGNYRNISLTDLRKMTIGDRKIFINSLNDNYENSFEVFQMKTILEMMAKRPSLF